MGIEMFMENGVSFTRLFQENFLNLHSLMQIINLITEPEGALLLFLAIYWGINRDHGSRYLYLWGLIISIFSILQHLIQFPSPFWLDSSILLEETGSFAAPNTNVAISLLVVLPFSRKIRSDLVLIAYAGIAALTGLSQLYLGIATFVDIALGFVLAAMLIGMWSVWNKRFGRRFASRILGQRFWLAILFPIILSILYFVSISQIKRLGYTGMSQVDPALYWRAWQTGFINTLTALGLLFGIGTGIAFETGRIGFRPAGDFTSAFTNSVVGILVLGITVYLLSSFIPIATIYENGRPLDLIMVATQCMVVGLTATYIIPKIFTLLGTAASEVPDTPDISLKNFA